MALMYIGIGFYYSKEIRTLLEKKSIKLDAVAGVVCLALLLILKLIYKANDSLNIIDMKLVLYKELLLSILIPCMFGFTLARLIHELCSIEWLNKLSNFLQFCGRATVPIMFMHVPLNNYKEYLNCGGILYVLIGVGVPLLITKIFENNQKVQKLLGLPELSFKS